MSFLLFYICEEPLQEKPFALTSCLGDGKNVPLDYDEAYSRGTAFRSLGVRFLLYRSGDA